jgi:RNA polymerase sigma factor (sigma-70 family)
MRHEPASDVEWIRSALDRFEAPLVRYATRFTRDADRARDVVQDTFVRLCDSVGDRSRIEPRLAEWLFTVCRRRAIEIGRKEGRMAPLDDAIQVEGPASDAAPPDLALQGEELAGEISRLLATLPARQQEVIRLKIQDGLSYREISRITRLSETNVGYLIHVGLKTLRERVKSRASLRPEA